MPWVKNAFLHATSLYADLEKNMSMVGNCFSLTLLLLS